MSQTWQKKYGVNAAVVAEKYTADVTGKIWRRRGRKICPDVAEKYSADVQKNMVQTWQKR